MWFYAKTIIPSVTSLQRILNPQDRKVIIDVSYWPDDGQLCYWDCFTGKQRNISGRESSIK